MQERACVRVPCFRVKIVYNYGLCGIKKMCFAAGADRRGREVGPELLYKLKPNGAHRTYRVQTATDFNLFHTSVIY